MDHLLCNKNWVYDLLRFNSMQTQDEHKLIILLFDCLVAGVEKQFECRGLIDVPSINVAF